MINPNEVTVVGADAAVLSWPVRARLESIGIIPNKMQIRTSNTGHWKPIDINQSQDSSGDGNPSNDPDQGGTLWVFERINGKWYASGAERLRPSQLNGDKPVADPTQGGLSTLIGNGWLYDSKWGAMAGVNPKPGDLVGFMVASGSTRLDNRSEEKERTDIIVCRWPDASGRLPFEEVWREGVAAPVENPPAPPADNPPAQEPPAADPAVAERVAALEERVATLEKKLAEAVARVSNVTATVTVFGVKIPVVLNTPEPSEK